MRFKVSAHYRTPKTVRFNSSYHAQDTERAAEGGGIYLNYGATEEGEENALVVGREIAMGLAHYGLKVIWDGTIQKRIGVELDWKRRRSS